MTNIYFLQPIGLGNHHYIIFFQEFFFCFVLTSKQYHILYAFLTFFTLQVHPCKWQGFILLWLNDRYPIMCVIVYIFFEHSPVSGHSDSSHIVGYSG